MSFDNTCKFLAETFSQSNHSVVFRFSYTGRELDAERGLQCDRVNYTYNAVSQIMIGIVCKTIIKTVLSVVVIVSNLFAYRITYLALFDYKDSIYPYSTYGAPELIDMKELGSIIFALFFGLTISILSSSISYWILHPRVYSKYLKFFFTILTFLSLLAILLTGYRFVELLYHFLTVEVCDNYRGNGFGCK